MNVFLKIVFISFIIFIFGCVAYFIIDLITGDTYQSRGIIIDKKYIPGHYKREYNQEMERYENKYVEPNYDIYVNDVELGEIKISTSEGMYRACSIGDEIQYNVLIGGISHKYCGAFSIKIIRSRRDSE